MKQQLLAHSSNLYDGTTFYTTRAGIWVDRNLEVLVDLVGHTRLDDIPTSHRLNEDENEVTMFGRSGSKKHLETLRRAVGLDQIEELIKAQWNGEAGELNTSGAINIFPIKGKNGRLCVILVHRSGNTWFVNCYPFRPDFVWRVGRLVFSN
jgi:hypothetical protein